MSWLHEFFWLLEPRRKKIAPLLSSSATALSTCLGTGWLTLLRCLPLCLTYRGNVYNQLRLNVSFSEGWSKLSLYVWFPSLCSLSPVAVNLLLPQLKSAATVIISVSTRLLKWNVPSNKDTLRRQFHISVFAQTSRSLSFFSISTLCKVTKNLSNRGKDSLSSCVLAALCQNIPICSFISCFRAVGLYLTLLCFGTKIQWRLLDKYFYAI